MEELFPSARPDYSYVIYYEAVYVINIVIKIIIPNLVI